MLVAFCSSRREEAQISFRVRAALSRLLLLRELNLRARRLELDSVGEALHFGDGD